MTDLKIKVILEEQCEEVKFILPDKDRILVGVIVTLSHNNSAILEYYNKKILEYKYQILECSLPLHEILKCYNSFW